MLTTRTADIVSLGLLALVGVITLVLYPGLPEQIPTHWNAAGEVDDYMSKPWGVILTPLSAAGTWALFKIIPAISPKGFRTTEFQNVISVLQLAMVSLFSLVSLLVLFAAKGVNVHIDIVVPIGIGLLFIVIGNYLGKVRKNFFIGIRTPWTLASDEVWYRTHRLAGWTFSLSGVVLMAAAIWPRKIMWLVGMVLVLALIPVVYSYFLYRRIEGFSDESG